MIEGGIEEFDWPKRYLDGAGFRVPSPLAILADLHAAAPILDSQ